MRRKRPKKKPTTLHVILAPFPFSRDTKMPVAPFWCVLRPKCIRIFSSYYPKLSNEPKFVNLWPLEVQPIKCGDSANFT